MFYLASGFMFLYLLAVDLTGGGRWKCPTALTLLAYCNIFMLYNPLMFTIGEINDHKDYQWYKITMDLKYNVLYLLIIVDENNMIFFLSYRSVPKSGFLSWYFLITDSVP